MSVEFLLLLAIFLLLPLIERILQSARQRAEPPPQPTETAPPRPPRPPEPVWEPEPVPPPRMPRAEVPAPPALRRLAESDAENRRARARALAAAREAARRPAPRPEPRRRNPIVESLRTPDGLRRAIVLMTILGPCRAAARPGSEWER